MADKPNLVHVQIFGQSYSLRAGDDPAYLERLAAYVDQEMSEVGKAAGAVDSVRVAVLAALNIADELMRARDAEKGDAELGARAAGLARELQAVLDEEPIELAPGTPRPYHGSRRPPALFVMGSEASNQRP